MDGVCSLEGWIALGEEEEALDSEEGTERVVGNFWSHSQTVRVSQAVAEIVGSPGVEAGSRDGDVGGNTAASAGLEGAVVVVGMAARVGGQGHEERKVVAGRR